MGKKKARKKLDVARERCRVAVGAYSDEEICVATVRLVLAIHDPRCAGIVVADPTTGMEVTDVWISALAKEFHRRDLMGQCSETAARLGQEDAIAGLLAVERPTRMDA